ncbi:MAG: non-heme iron oxygenase ferredoxin subunit [Alphaproteobacteria bacterium]|nr:non-heme iron oxygenase ferredoxin subunit [Alphaproteobacteria bacterium]MCY4497289.1 non-heme iron oxygenase ferredoxin subunit [Rhodospirillaceae bacterium]
MAEEWHLVASTDDIEEEDVLGVNVEGTAVAVYNVKGEFYATENVCTHAFAFLSEGIVIDDIIECPVHQGRFHIPTGKPKGAPVSVALDTYATKVENGKIYVRLKGEGDP